MVLTCTRHLAMSVIGLIVSLESSHLHSALSCCLYDMCDRNFHVGHCVYENTGQSLSELVRPVLQDMLPFAFLGAPLKPAGLKGFW